MGAWFDQIYAYLAAGGAVMGLIVILSCLMWGLIAERLLYLRRQERDRGLNLDELARRGVRAEGLRARLVSWFALVRTGETATDRRLLEEYVLREQPLIKQGLPLIAVLAAVAPLLGLFGTVTGMSISFDAIARFGLGNVRAVSGGIASALVTTQAGLVVAIPGMAMYVILERRASRLELGLLETAMALQGPDPEVGS